MKTRSNVVSNEGLRREFLRKRERGELDARLVAIRLGWVTTTNGRRPEQPDTTKVLRRLGLVLKSPPANYRRSKNYSPGYAEYITWETASRLCEAIGCWPDEVDL